MTHTARRCPRLEWYDLADRVLREFSEPRSVRPDMMELITAAAVAFGIVFVAELGDKTQLLALGFGARHSLRQVALGLLLGYGAAGVIAVVVGGVLGATFPQRPIEIGGGLIFLGFAVMALLEGRDDGPEANESGDQVSRATILFRSSVVASIGLTILIAEMGDKTQIATAALASRSSPIGTWIGATLGEVTSGMLGAVAGTLIGDRIPPDRLRLASAFLFAAFGVVMLSGVL